MNYHVALWYKHQADNINSGFKSRDEIFKRILWDKYMENLK